MWGWGAYLQHAGHGIDGVALLDEMPHLKRLKRKLIMVSKLAVLKRTRIKILCQAEKSRIVVKMWREAPASTKAYYEHLSEVAKEEHKLKYPDYRFKPIK